MKATEPDVRRRAAPVRPSTRERDHRRAAGDRVAVGQGRAHGAGHDRRGARLDVPPPGRAPAGARGRRTDRQHQRRLPRGRRRRHGSCRDERGHGAPRRLGPHRRRRRGLGTGPRLQRRDRGVHRARRASGRGRARPARRARGGAADLRRHGARERGRGGRPRFPHRGAPARRPGGLARPACRRRGGDRDGPRAARGRTLRDPHVHARRAGVRRGARAAAAPARLRRRARRDPARARGSGHRVEPDRRRRPARLPHPRALPRGGGVRARRGAGAGGEGRRRSTDGRT